MLLRFGAGCTKADIEEHEKVKLFAARIVTGLTIIASRNSLYLGNG